MRVACVHWGFPPIIGGVENHLVTILPQMVKWGHKVSILTGTTAQTKTKYTYRGVKVWRTPLMDINWLARRGFEGLGPKILKMFEEFFETFQPDVIHCHNLHYFSRMHAKDVERISKEKGIPLVLTAHNMWDDVLCLDLTRRVAWSHIIAVSRFIKRELLGVGCEIKANDDNPVTIFDKFKQERSKDDAFDSIFIKTRSDVYALYALIVSAVSLVILVILSLVQFF